MGIKVFFSSIIFPKHHNFLTKNCIPVPFCWSFVCWANSLFSFSDFLFFQINFFLKILNFFKFLIFFKWMLTRKKFWVKKWDQFPFMFFGSEGSTRQSIFGLSSIVLSFSFSHPRLSILFARNIDTDRNR